MVAAHEGVGYRAPMRPLVQASAIIVGSIIGAGIFVTPSIVAELAGTPKAALVAWTLGGLLALAGGLAYTELACAHRRVGGDYVFLRETFGPLVGFLDGWIVIGVVFPGSIAALSLAFSEAISGAGGVVPADAGLLSIMIGPYLVDLAIHELIALALIVLLCLANLGRVTTTLDTSTWLNGLKLLVLVGVAAWLTSQGDIPLQAPKNTQASLAGIGAALVPVFFAWSGWNAATYIAPELANPEKVLPRALIIGLMATLVAYLLFNMGLFEVIGYHRVAKNSDAFALAANKAYGSHWARIGASAIIALILVGTVYAMLLTGARVIEAMAKDGLLPAPLAKRAGSDRAPSNALGALGIWAGLLCMTGRVDRLVEFTTAGVVLLSAATVIAVPVRRRMRKPDGGYRIPGGPYAIPAFYLLGCAWAIWGVWRYDPSGVLWGFGIAALGIIPGLWVTRRHRPQTTP